MAKELGLVQRGLLLLGLMLVTAVVVLFIILRRGDNPPTQKLPSGELAAISVAKIIGGFPDGSYWGGVATLGQQLPSLPGKEVRYNAAISFARRGSPKTPLDVLCQMLDEDQQMRNFRVRIAEGEEVVDDYAAWQTVLNALKAFETWHKNKKTVEAVGANNPQLKCIYTAVDKLTTSRNATVQKEAESIQKKIKSGVW